MSTKAKGSPCPVKGCEHIAKPRMLMCWWHWRRVPKILNRLVYDTLAAWQRDETSAARKAYMTARDAAIAAVEAKEAEESKNG